MTRDKKDAHFSYGTVLVNYPALKGGAWSPKTSSQVDQGKR